MVTSLMRAAHTRHSRPPLIQDAWADRLLPERLRTLGAEEILQAAGFFRAWWLRLRLRSRQAIVDYGMRRAPAFGGVIIRQRFTEDALAQAVQRGATQYVILGAGLDSFAWRQPAWAKTIQIFEVDHPATQQFKQKRVAACGAGVPPNLHFVAADLANEPLAVALARSAYRREAVSFVSWLGVTIYLTRDANLTTLRAVAECCASGSELAFTYIEQAALDTPSPGLARLMASLAAAGEPWLSGFYAKCLGDDLKAVGLTLVEDLGKAEMLERYCRGRRDGLTPGGGGHVARARVG
jgi:methyltransferase (TIGR00027 family)